MKNTELEKEIIDLLNRLEDGIYCVDTLSYGKFKVIKRNQIDIFNKDNVLVKKYDNSIVYSKETISIDNLVEIAMGLNKQYKIKPADDVLVPSRMLIELNNLIGGVYKFIVNDEYYYLTMNDFKYKKLFNNEGKIYNPLYNLRDNFFLNDGIEEQILSYLDKEKDFQSPEMNEFFEQTRKELRSKSKTLALQLLK